MGEFSIRTRPFRLGWADYRALWLAFIGRYFTTFPAVLGTFYVLIVLPVLFGVLPRASYGPYIWVQAGALAVFLLIALADLFFLHRRYRGIPAMRHERIMVLDSGAVRLIGAGMDFRQVWDGFGSQWQSRRHVFVHLPGLPTYVIPKDALATADDAARLNLQARTLIRQARKTPRVLPPLPETPERRELWRSRPFPLTLGLAYGHAFRAVWTIALTVLGLAALVLAALRWLAGPVDPRDTLILFLSLAVLVVNANAAIFAHWFGRVRWRPATRGLREVSFTRDYVRCTAPAFDLRLDWAHIRDVYAVPGAIVFRLPAGRLAVPRSAFTSRPQATAFLTQAIAFWRAAKARQ